MLNANPMTDKARYWLSRMECPDTNSCANSLIALGIYGDRVQARIDISGTFKSGYYDSIHTANAWHYHSFAVNHGSGTVSTKYYIDGSEQGNTNYSGTFTDTSISQFVIGYRKAWKSTYYAGFIHS